MLRSAFRPVQFGDGLKEGVALSVPDVPVGVEAVDLLEKGIGKRVIAYKDSKIVNYDIVEALSMERKFDTHLYEVAMEASI